MNNNNKKPNDGRKNNKRKGRTKIIRNDSITPSRVNTAKKSRAKLLSKKAIRNIFGSEDGVWDSLAKLAQDGNIKALEMLLQYQYGKAGEKTETRTATTKAPVINFNVTPQEPPQLDNTIDITEEE